MNDPQKESCEDFEACFSVLVTSIAQTAVMSLGLAPNPQTHQVEKDKQMARFNIDLLTVLQQKTKGNLTADESSFLNALVSDLQLKFVQMKD